MYTTMLRLRWNFTRATRECPTASEIFETICSLGSMTMRIWWKSVAQSKCTHRQKIGKDDINYNDWEWNSLKWAICRIMFWHLLAVGCNLDNSVHSTDSQTGGNSKGKLYLIIECGNRERIVAEDIFEKFSWRHRWECDERRLVARIWFL